MIVLEKAREDKILSESIADMTVPAEVARVTSPVNLIGRYNWAMSDADLDVAKKLRLTSIKIYWRCAGQVEMELDWLYDWIPTLTIFVRYSRRMYNNKEVGQNMSVRRDIDPEWVLSFFV